MQHSPEIEQPRRKSHWPWWPSLRYLCGMRRILRCAFVGLLSLALTASGTALGFAHISPTHPGPEEHTHHSAAYVGHEHHSHTGVAQPPAGKDKQPSSSHP